MFRPIMKWFRWYRGTAEDVKFALIANMADQPGSAGEGNRCYGAVTVTDVVAVWAVILEDACRKDHRGVCKKDAKFIATILRWWPDEVQSVLDSMVELGLLERLDGYVKVTKWEERQYLSDTDPTNSKRQSRYRERHKQPGNKPPTGTKRARNALPKRPETETETETEKKEDSHLSACADPPESLDKIPNRMMNDWNQLADENGLSKAVKLTPARRAAARKRWSDAGGESGWAEALNSIRASPFLLGQNDRGWRANFDFLLRESSFVKLQEGAYSGGNGKIDWSDMDDPE